jgi:hypothetical protein
MIRIAGAKDPPVLMNPRDLYEREKKREERHSHWQFMNPRDLYEREKKREERQSHWQFMNPRDLYVPWGISTTSSSPCTTP